MVQHTLTRESGVQVPPTPEAVSFLLAVKFHFSLVVRFNFCLLLGLSIKHYCLMLLYRVGIENGPSITHMLNNKPI